MKYKIALLLLVSPSILFAQPIHRCVDNQGQLSFQSNPCPNIEARLTNFNPNDNAMTGEQAEPGRIDAHAERQRVQAVLNADAAEKDGLDDGNQARCLDALRAAKMCGRFAGMFSCGKHGFQHEEPGAKSSVELLHAVKSGGETSMQQCVQQVSK